MFFKLISHSCYEMIFTLQWQQVMHLIVNFFFGGICIKMASEVLINNFKNMKCFKTGTPMSTESCLAAAQSVRP